MVFIRQVLWMLPKWPRCLIVMGGGDVFEEEPLDKAMQERKTDENDDETSSEASSTPVWETDSRKGLLQVLKAFRALVDEFNEKFKAVWA